MDTLSRLLSLCSLRTALDIRCSLAAPWVIDEAPAAAGTAPFHMIVDGRATAELPDGARVDLLPGDIVVFPQGGAHRLHAGALERATPVHEVPGPDYLRWKANEGSGPHSGILCGRFLFDADARRLVQRALPDTIIVRTGERPDFAGLYALVMMLRSETDSALPGAAAVVAQLSSALFALVLRAWLEQEPGTPGLLAVLADRRIGPAMQKMLAHPGQPWTIDQLAQACFMSRATFARVFRELAGMTPLDALTQLRMAQAAQWLQRDAQAVAAIGEAVGYQSEAAFNRAFKRSHGVGPGEYRRTVRSAVMGSSR